MPQRPYHHGNLRETLLQGALQAISELGPAAFTLREVARRAGVSHNAPYRHFRDKDALLAAVAAQGFRELTRAMREAADRQPNALDKLKHSGLAYVALSLRVCSSRREPSPCGSSSIAPANCRIRASRNRRRQRATDR